MPDQRWIDEAERRLPCKHDCPYADDYHIVFCPAFYRPAVAQALQEAYEAGVSEYNNAKPATDMKEQAHDARA